MKNTSGFINQQADPYLYMEKQTNNQNHSKNDQSCETYNTDLTTYNKPQ